MTTLEMLERLFSNKSELADVAKVIDIYKDKFGLNTKLRLKHFLAQVREEVGPEFKVRRENLNYHEDVLPKLYKAFDKELAEKYGRDEKDKADQVSIANIAYANKLGNGSADSDGDGDMDKDDDGWKYRGAGCLQITGKSNFEEVQKRCVRYAGKEMDPDTLEGFVVFGMAYWMRFDLYRIADGGEYGVVVDNITAKINKYTTSYERRRTHFEKLIEN